MAEFDVHVIYTNSYTRTDRCSSAGVRAVWWERRGSEGEGGADGGGELSPRSAAVALCSPPTVAFTVLIVHPQVLLTLSRFEQVVFIIYT